MEDLKSKICMTVSEFDFNNDFVIDDINEKKYSYKEYFKKCISIATTLNEKYTEKSIIAIMENSVELSMLYFAIMFTNYQLIVIDPQKSIQEIRTLLEGIPNAIVISEVNLTEHEIKRFNLIEWKALDESVLSISDVKNETLYRLSECNFNDLFLVTYTSGTSKIAKGVKHSFANLFLSAYALHEKVETKKNSRLLHIMPMTYMAGILNSLIYPFIVGASIVILNRFTILTARFFWEKSIKYSANLFWISPAMLKIIEQLDRSIQGENYAKTHELTFLVGTAALMNSTRNKFEQKYGTTVYTSYGLTETLFVSVETKRSIKKEIKNSVGEILNGVKYKLFDGSELLIDVPWMYVEYTNEDKSLYMQQNYYKTGDLAKIEEENLFIIGRSKDLIIKGGMNISPIVIEECLMGNTSIIECSVFSVIDASEEEKICCAYVCKSEAGNIFEEELRQLIRQNLGKNYMIDYFLAVNSIEKNLNGKVDKNKMKMVWEYIYGK